ncbi:MAG: SAM-dependent methyltransferase [Leptospiraceae bacterium]|nr:SAM-dependent methyltransferase [Leptospiraceae bacterium]
MLPISFEENTVYLVGGGSGNLKHLTLEGYSILKQAEIILHDKFMEEMKPHFPLAEWINVGKSKGAHVKKQSEINALLIEYTVKNKRVVRLKAGDPSIFARSSEEIAALKQVGVNVKIVPGISSPQILASELGESMTHRLFTRSLSYWSGYWDANIKPCEIQSTDAHFIFMGMGEIFSIIEKMLEAGKDEDTSLIAASNLGRFNQKIIFTTLKKAKQELKLEELDSPTLFAIGLNHINLGLNEKEFTLENYNAR